MIASCRREATPATHRIAFLPFENLTGDPSLDWVSTAAANIGAEDLTGSQAIPLRASTMGDAYLERADFAIHGYFTGTAKSLHFEVVPEDLPKHKMAPAAVVSGDVLTAINTATRAIVPSAHEFPSTNAEAVAAWGHGDYEHATALDPDFGGAWLAWAEKTQREGNRDRALEIAQQGLDRKSLKSDTDRARLELFTADIRQDVAAREKALDDLYKQARSDLGVLSALTDAATRARDFQNAMLHARELAKLSPENPNVLLSLGYAEGFAGDLNAARATFDRYGALPNQKPNALDSYGETLFMHGKFAEAETYFADAHRANPALSQGEDMLKAAYSRWLMNDASAADLTAADKEFAQYLKYRTNQHDPLIVWREASWLWATGRRPQAMKEIEQLPDKQLGAKQTAVWRGQIQLSKDVDALKKRFYATTPSSDGQIRLLYAAALIDAGKKDDARALLELWPMPWAPGDPVLDSWVIGEYRELRAAVGLH